MKTWKWITICVASLTAGAIIAGIGTAVYFTKNKTTIIKWKSQTSKTEYGKNPKPVSEYKSCAISPVWIEAEQDKLDIIIGAGGDCKSASRILRLSTIYPVKHHNLSFFPIIALHYDVTSGIPEFGYGGSITYFYSWGLVGLGIGPGVIKFPASYDIFIQAGIKFQF